MSFPARHAHTSMPFFRETALFLHFYSQGENGPSHFGKLIAAGTQTSTMMAGAVARNLCRIKPSLGLETSFKFRRVVLVDELLKAQWEIAKIQHNCRLKGDIVAIDCELRNESDLLLVERVIVILISGLDQPAGILMDCCMSPLQKRRRGWSFKVAFFVAHRRHGLGSNILQK